MKQYVLLKRNVTADELQASLRGLIRDHFVIVAVTTVSPFRYFQTNEQPATADYLIVHREYTPEEKAHVEFN